MRLPYRLKLVHMAIGCAAAYGSAAGTLAIEVPHGSVEVPPMLGTLNGPNFLVSLDRETAIGTRIGSLGLHGIDAMTALEYDGVHNILYGATSSNTPDLYTVDPNSGSATRVSTQGSLGILATGMAYNPISDTLYVSGGNRASRKSLYTVDRTSGTSTLIGEISGVTDSIQGLAFNPQTRTLYGLDEFESVGARIVAIDVDSLVATPLTGDIDSVANGWGGLAYDPHTGSLFASSNLFLYKIDPMTAESFKVGIVFSPEAHTVGSITIVAPFVVPEPTCVSLALLGASLLCYFGWCR